MDITLEDLGVAYRKAKVDLYYSSHPSIQSILEYEKNLLQNLKNLLGKLNRRKLDWIKNEAYLGTWTMVPKSISWKDREALREKDGGVIFSSPEDEWDSACALLSENSDFEKPVAEFRLMAQVSVDFHVVSSLWMLEVGHLFDSKLSRNSFGNRLRRKKNGDVNRGALGSFSPYLKPFRTWRDKGIEAMRTALDSNVETIALTADVSSFYHELNPDFMLDDDFNKMVGVELSENQDKIHRIFIQSLKQWAKSTPLKRGLPVGLPASAVVANLALIELDHLIEREVIPLYYGRYVDDILLVMENGAKLKTATALWEWIFARSNGKLGWVRESGINRAVQFSPIYFSKGSGKSQIRLSNEKNKVFMLSGDSGRVLIDSIALEIQARASEWRGMPRLPSLASHVGPELVAATQNDGEVADTLRKADSLTMRRAGFAIKLRDIEAYERDLPPEAWGEHRHAFLRAFIQHVLVLPNFFELAIYLPRVIRLATACEDFYYLRKIAIRLGDIVQSVATNCDLSIKACTMEFTPALSDIIENWKRQIQIGFLESVAAAFPTNLSNSGKNSWWKYIECSIASKGDRFPTFLKQIPSISELSRLQVQLFYHDLAHMPLRFAGLPREMVSQRGIPDKENIISFEDEDSLLDKYIVTGIRILARWMGLKNLVPIGLFFCTRPYKLAELYVVSKKPFDKPKKNRLSEVILALRGFAPQKGMPCFNGGRVLTVPSSRAHGKHVIAVSSWKTLEESWIASVTKKSDPDLDRYSRINRLIDSVISQPKGASYLILPELAMPGKWFMRAAQKLHGRGISLITGIEYLHYSKKTVSNQVWAALSHDGLGFSSMMIYRQEKQRAALREEQELKRIAGLKLAPKLNWDEPPIIRHGDFYFSVLVCSELTNIKYRTSLRGRIDALFVPEWNQDTETFNALIESAALDIHAFIIQCNDRQYGDSRIRGPYKDAWRRDVLRVKGGVDDYCVSGEIEIYALRKFQSSHRSPAGPFKPIPDGYKLRRRRFKLPN